MGETKPLPKKGDRCPQCGGELVEQRVATAEEYRGIIDKENPRPVPLNVDTMDPATVAELGTLAKCSTCRYQTRFAPKAKKEKAAAVVNGD